MSFLAETVFVPMAMCNFAAYVMSFSDMLNVFHSLPHLFCSFHLTFPAMCQLSDAQPLGLLFSDFWITSLL